MKQNKWFFLIVFILLSGCASNSVSILSEGRMKDYSATIKGVFETPEGDGPFPVVILMHGCGGLSRYVKSSLNAHANALRNQGFATLVLDSFGPRGLFAQCNLLQLATARDYRVYDAFNALEVIRKNPLVDPKNIFLVGQSNGGSVALIAAGGGKYSKMTSDLRFTAIVAYYPWCAVTPASIVSPLLVFGAGNDDWVSAEECETKKNYVEGSSMEVVIYPKTDHSFDLSIPRQKYQGRWVGGNKFAREDSRKSMIEFFKNNLTE